MRETTSRVCYRRKDIFVSLFLSLLTQQDEMEYTVCGKTELKNTKKSEWLWRPQRLQIVTNITFQYRVPVAKYSHLSKFSYQLEIQLWSEQVRPQSSTNDMNAFLSSKERGGGWWTGIFG